MDLGVEETEETPTAAEGSDGEVSGTGVAPTAAVQVENQYQELAHTASATAAVVEAGTHTVSLKILAPF